MQWDVELHARMPVPKDAKTAADIPKPVRIESFTVQAPTMDMAHYAVLDALKARGWKRVLSCNLAGDKKKPHFYAIVERPAVPATRLGA
jgi:hypothetical protein